MNRINTQIYDEASEWFIRHRSDDLDADAKRRFDSWLRESPNHLRAYLEMSAIWEDLPALDPTRNVSADELIARARKESNVHPLGESHSGAFEALKGLAPLETLKALPVVTGPASQHSGFGRYATAIAALLLIMVGFSGWLYLQRGAYTTEIGEQRTIALTDGSSVELNARSKIRVRYTDQKRAIELLKGQALFKVAKDVSRPFVVESNGSSVRAVGTQFDVYRKAGGTIVTVVEGRVAVLPSTAPGSGVSGIAGQAARTRDISHLTPKLGEVLLTAGQQIRIAAPQLAASGQHDPAPELAAPVRNTGTVPTSSPTAGTVPTPQPANIEAATAWTQQRLIFENASLNEVAEEFNRYNHRSLIVDDSALNDFHISGNFSSTDPALLLRFLRKQPGIAVTETASEIHISRQDAGAG